jgi:hypothetical protein
LNNCQEDSIPRPQRLPLPAPVVLAILALAKRLLSSVHWDRRDPQLLLLRAATTSIASYLFFNRGECSACALTGDIAIDDTHITLQLRHEKGNNALNEGHMNARQVPAAEVPRIAPMLAAFFTCACSMGKRTRRRALSPAKDIELWTADTLSGWLSTAYNATHCLPPAGFA